MDLLSKELGFVILTFTHIGLLLSLVLFLAFTRHFYAFFSTKMLYLYHYTLVAMAAIVIISGSAIALLGINASPGSSIWTTILGIANILFTLPILKSLLSK